MVRGSQACPSDWWEETIDAHLARLFNFNLYMCQANHIHKNKTHTHIQNTHTHTHTHTHSSLGPVVRLPPVIWQSVGSKLAKVAQDFFPDREWLLSSLSKRMGVCDMSQLYS